MKISINSLTFKYDDNVIFDKLRLTIKENKFTSIIMSNSKGKTTLSKILSGNIHTNKVSIDKIASTNLKDKVYLVSKENDFDSIIKNIKLNENLNQVLSKFKLDNILEIDDLNIHEKVTISLVNALVNKYEIIVLDDVYNLIDIDILKKLKDTTVINITSDIESTLISNEVIFIDKKVVLKGSSKKVLTCESEINALGFKLPFIIELSNRLKFYDLIDKDYYDMKLLVDELWK